jgi:hypothetical protein
VLEAAPWLIFHVVVVEVPKVEKRRYQRLPREVAVDITYLDTATKKRTEVERSCSRNLSAVGLLVTTDKKLEPGKTVEVRFYLPDSPEEAVLTARVVRVEELVSGEFYDIGLEFTNVDDLTLAKINALVMQDSTEE